MTSREIVRKTLSHIQPDGVPLDLGSTSVTGIHVTVYCKLKEAFHDIGVDIINPVQYSANDMDLCFLKDTYGDRITFCEGGTDTQHTLPFEIPEEMQEAVIQNIEALLKKGGFVFSSIHDIQPEVPEENMKAMFGTVNEYREYSKVTESS
jgi:uroporphyrinogen-III decarboxylase